MLALAFVDGARRHRRGCCGDQYEYLRTARRSTDLPATLPEYVAGSPTTAGRDNWPVHVAGHPPGALLSSSLLDRLGLGGGFAAGVVVTRAGRDHRASPCW